MSTALSTRPVLYRDTADALLGGVAGGLADHFGIRDAGGRWLLRLGFVALSFTQGIGIVLYAAFWIVIPPDPAHLAPRRRGWLRVVVGGIAIGVAASALFGTITVRYFLPVALALIGGALIWRQATESERERWVRISQSSLRAPVADRVGLARMACGVVMVVAGVAISIGRHNSLSQLRDALFAIAVLAVGMALITGPLWIRTVSELAEERRERIRSAEREEMAAHLHDSVLQTLALIQRNADSPREVTRLARGQERELRKRLYGARAATGTLANALHAAAAEVEDDYAIAIDEVVVGDAPGSADLTALAQATREALVNAAKHAGVTSVSLYAEVDADAVEVFVRDRGRGFDPAAVPEDRHGLRGSIRERMERHGGTADIRSTVGEGTEVRLSMRRRKGGSP